MSLALSFNICQSGDCSILTLNETTGIYNAVSNVGGWGAPNADIADYHYAKLEFFLNGVLVKTFEFNNEFFPSNDSAFEYELSYSIPDGVYTIVYTVQEDKDIPGVTYTKTIYQSFYCNTKCCVMSMVNDIDLDCDCSKDSIEEFNKAYALLKGLQYSSGCGNITNFNNILAQINKICANNNCQNCQ